MTTLPQYFANVHSRLVTISTSDRPDLEGALSEFSAPLSLTVWQDQYDDTTGTVVIHTDTAGWFIDAFPSLEHEDDPPVLFTDQISRIVVEEVGQPGLEFTWDYDAAYIKLSYRPGLPPSDGHETPDFDELRDRLTKAVDAWPWEVRYHVEALYKSLGVPYPS